MSKLEEQHRIEKLYDRGYMDTIKLYIEENVMPIVENQRENFEEYYEIFKGNEDIADEVLIDSLLMLSDVVNTAIKRTNSGNPYMPLDKAVTILLAVTSKYASNREGALQASAMILDALDGKLLDIEEEIDKVGNELQWIRLYIPIPTLDDSDIPVMTGSLMPMVVPPRDWKANEKHGGYLSDKFKLILNKGDDFQEENAIKHLNTLQQIEWRISPNALKANPVQFWVDSAVKKGTAEGPAFHVAKQKKEFYNKALNYYKEETVYLPWNMDFRSRTYAKGYIVNSQGDKITKGTLIPKNSKKFTERGLYWQTVNIANLFGDDKLTFQDRFDKYSKSPDELREAVEEADSPIEYMNAIDSLEEAQLTGSADSLVYMDASNQALQMYAILTGDRRTAEACNLANGNNRADAYAMFSDRINKRLNTDFFTRNHTKWALMTAMYGKMDITSEIFKVMFPGENQTDCHIAVAEQFNLSFDNEENRCLEFDAIVNHALEDIAPRAIETMNIILGHHDARAKVIKWKTTNGFKVQFDVKEKMQYDFAYTFKNGYMFSLAGSYTRYNCSDSSRALAPNVIHSFDGYVASEVVNRMKERGLFITTIFDAFGCHANDVDVMMEIYEDILVELLDSNELSRVLSEITRRKITIEKGDLNETDIRKSVYKLG